MYQVVFPMFWRLLEPLISVAGFSDRVIKKDGVKDDVRSCRSFVNAVYEGTTAFLEHSIASCFICH